MVQTSRRNFLSMAAAAGAVAPISLRTTGASASSMPDAKTVSLMDALSKRRSTRLYSDETVDEETLQTLLWCACGINRPESGGRTAPSWRTSYGTDIHVADASGVRSYDPLAGTLSSRLDEDVRGKASQQPFVATAPTVLIYVADLARMYKASREELVQAAHIDAGIVAQNVYLYCAAAGLGTCLVGGAYKPVLTGLLKLPETQIVTFVQPVGHPKQPA